MRSEERSFSLAECSPIIECEFVHDGATMKIQINGQSRDFSSPLSLTALVEQLGMKTDRVAVELNGEIAPRDRWASTHLVEADRLEIVHFVGGGGPGSF